MARLAMPVFALLMLQAIPAFAADDRVLALPSLSAEITVDGVADEPFWADALRVELAFETRPADNTATPPDLKTTARLVDAGDALLIVIDARDAEPGKIRAFLRDRDQAYSDDFVGVNLDTFNDERRAYEFYANPLGIQMDLVFEESKGEDDAWDTQWQSAGRIDDGGYVVEFRIPYSSVRFQQRNGQQRWGIDIVRFHQRAYQYRFALARNERGSNCYLCNLPKLEGFAQATPGRGIEIVPTLTARYAQSRPSAGAPLASEGAVFEAGGDIAWNPTPNLSLSATINPDFSQVETDSAQLDVNTTFALFFPEKRPFFLESADYFSTEFNLLYTRQITDPDIGLRATGKDNRSTWGVFVARDAVTNLLIPGTFGSQFTQLDTESDVAVGRYRFDATDELSIGGFVSARHGDDYRNDVGAVDGRWRSGNYSVAGQLVASSSAYPGAPAALDDWAGLVGYDYRTRNWNARIQHQRIGEDFRADLGFIGQVGFDRSLIGGGRIWHGEDGARISRSDIYSDFDITRDADGRIIEREIEAFFTVNGPLQSVAQIGGLSRYRVFADQGFDEQFVTAFAEFRPTARLSAGVFARVGEAIDFANVALGDSVIIEPRVGIAIGRGVTLDVSHSYQRLERDGGLVFEANLTDFRAGWQITPRQRLRAALIRNDVQRDPALYSRPVDVRSRSIGSQVVYSYKLGPRSAFYAGYVDNYASEDDEPSLVQFDRALFFKVGYAFRP